MIKKIAELADKIKDNNTTFYSFVKLMYLVGNNSTLHSIISIIFGIIIPILWDTKHIIGAIFVLLIWVVDVVYLNVCKTYREGMFIERKLDSVFLKDQSSLVNSILIEMKNNAYWKHKIFKTVSELICEKIRRNFKEVLNCDTRVSVEYVFDKEKDGKIKQHIKMAGRRSPDRDTCKKAILFERKNKYYSYKIFNENRNGINILPDTDIKNPELWYCHTKSLNIKLYLGIAVSIFEENVDFILQIDCLNDITFGKDNSDREIEQFINTYLKGYINILSLSYLLNLNTKKKIVEV